MESRINQTLLQKLFLNPTPYDRKNKVYETLKHKLFPCEDVFIEFLSTADASEQRARAKYIVQRLCFDANFPPPFSLIENLADFETDTVNRAKSESYVPQDHFTHIVYMYLLGIYVFFYSRSINIALTKEFKSKRKENSFHLAKDATEDFIEYWKYFCLFHDLAYPIEQLYRPKSAASSKTRYLKCFNSLYNCLSREILSECAARFLVLWQMINDDENNALFCTVFKSLSVLMWSTVEPLSDASVPVDGKSIYNKFEKYKAVDKIHCYEHLKMFTGFVTAENYIAVLFDAMTEQPVAIKSVIGTNSHYYYLQEKYVELKASDAKVYLDSEDPLLIHNYYIRYYFNFDEESLKSFYLQSGPGSVFTDEKYRKIIDMLSDRFNSQPVQMIHFDKITTSNELNTYIFQTYQTILTYLNSATAPSEAFPKQTTHLKITNNRKIIDDFIENSFLEYFKTAVLSQLPFSDFDEANKKLKILKKTDSGKIDNTLIKDVICRAVEKLLNNKALDKYKKKIIEDFSSTLINAIENEKESNGAFIEFISQCNKELFSGLSVDQSVVFETKKVDVLKLFDMIKAASIDTALQKDLETYVKKRMQSFHSEEVSLFDFVSKYKTKYSTYDHGIYGSLVFLLCVQYYSKLIKELFASRSKPSAVDIMSTLCWNVDKSHYSRTLTEDNEYIIKAVLRSIFCHNLYPDALRKVYASSKKWCYVFAKEPSNYFAMMIDSLQVWNRSKYYSLSDIHWWPSFSSDNYDIIIQNDMIILKVLDYGASLSFLENKFIQKQEAYLKDFSSYVTIDIEHGK